MRQLFKIDESEKRRILEMHENATRKNYLSEQGNQTNNTPRQPFKDTNGNEYKLPAITDYSALNTLVDITDLDLKPLKTDMKNRVAFFVTGLLYQIGQKIDANALVCNGLKLEQIDNGMMTNAWNYLKGKAEMWNMQLPEKEFEFYKQVALAEGHQDATMGRDYLKTVALKRAKNNMTKIPNACQA
mgnify:CR=1 FL=1